MINKRVSVDVGGTFCDAYYEDGNRASSLKILSNSRLRCIVHKIIDDKTIVIHESWNLPYPKVLRGCYCIVSEQIKFKIETYSASDQTMSFYKKHKCRPGTVIDIGIDVEAPVFAAHLLTGIPVHKPLKDIELRIGTTKGTNALLELKGSLCVWITNHGFEDLLYIKTQQRPKLFQLNIPEPNLLHFKVIQTKARMDAEGNELYPLSTLEWKNIKMALPVDKNVPIAISLLHSYRNNSHEKTIQLKLKKSGYRFVSSSAELLPIIHFLPRSEAAVCNAYLSPLLHKFVKEVEIQAKPKSLHLNSSAGQSIDSHSFHPKDSLLSGPSGGIRAAERIAQAYRYQKMITFDMGGTSTDTARINGKAVLRFKTRIGDLEIASPSFEIETVAAGGGSIIDFEDARFVVGPKSAGAYPGPACYGKGGPFTLTDLNLLLGRLVPEAMSIPIEIEHAEKKFIELLAKTKLPSTLSDYPKILTGIAQIANEKMAEAVRKVTLSQGYNPAQYSLLVYGGAGGLHACAMADILNISTILIPYNAGILSATGVASSLIENIFIRQIDRPVHQCQKLLPGWIRSLYLDHRLEGQVLSDAKVYLKYQGQNHSIPLDRTKGMDLIKVFERQYKKQFGSTLVQPVELEKISIKTLSETREIIQKHKKITFKKIRPIRQSIDWTALSPGSMIYGPIIIYHQQATVYVEANWKVTVQSNKDLIVKRSTRSDVKIIWNPAIELELFGNRFKAIAEQMGAQLQHSAFSVNVKERLDFSCAILNQHGKLVANAPHIPVHLGSLGICARLIIKKYAIGPGDTILCNHPLFGGSHLPDLTLLKGVFDSKNHLVGYVVNRAHHAEIGGLTPGSMPPNAINLEQEGVTFLPIYIQKNGKFNWSQIRKILAHARYPSRDIQSNLLDIKAAMASLKTGESRLRDLAAIHGLKYTHQQMDSLLNQGQSEILKFIIKNNGRKFVALEKMDDQRTIKVCIKVIKPHLIIDFSGTSHVHPGNLNANPSIVWSVIIYVLRLLCEKDINLNEGLTKNVKLVLPNCFLSPTYSADPSKCPAVVGGNTEVSQRLTDTLLKALKLSACSQGTMNNFLFGDESTSYYETIGGGTGAGPTFDGRSAVHQHMTNTKITDPEELEVKYPVRLDHFKVRGKSGGQGKYTGGNGISRQISFLKPMVVTILAEHRSVAPYGLKGGENGKTGRQYLIRDDQIIEINSNQALVVNQGDSICIETPGGGGWGEK